MSLTLPKPFLERPIAHRALHDVAQGRPENSTGAIQAAIDAGYGIEIDLQLSSDGQAMVFHDYDLARLTGQSGPIHTRSAAELGQITLTHSADTIPSFAEVLAQVDGQVPLLVELKDQDGAMGPNVGPLEQATADSIASYSGPIALMSFNPHSVAALAKLAPDVPRGITTSTYAPADWPTIPEARRAELRDIPDFDRVGACFVSHNWRELDTPRIHQIKQTHPILCWTIRSAAEEAEARKIVDNITFETYPA